MKVLIADGGTGGHIFPAIAVADELKKRNDVESILFTGTPYGLESEIVPRHGYELRMIHVGGLIGKSLMQRLKTFMQMPGAYLESARIVRDFKPDVAIGFGAYSSGPVLVATHRKKIPILLVEPNAIPGMTNRIALGFANKVAVSYEDSAGVFKGKAVVTGTPVRPLKEVEQKREKFTLGVYCGSQGSRAINDVVIETLPELAKLKNEIHIIHQTGKADFDRVKSKYDAIAPFFEVTPFVYQVEEFYSSCDLLLCRAGAVTLAEITVFGKPAILIPLPTAAHNHQEQNAKRLAEAGAAKMILQNDFSPSALIQEIKSFFNNDEKLKQMSDTSRKLGKPDAAKKVADLAVSLTTEAQSVRKT
jgi:UDP-N-acetylglucosamine--N-acetylmuramyl-(pentapeptide) pyrophosphoryl-undecaprenol N-acetylglucosamine transferase